jgi:hypothetical protein
LPSAEKTLISQCWKSEWMHSVFAVGWMLNVPKGFMWWRLHRVVLLGGDWSFRRWGLAWGV